MPIKLALNAIEDSQGNRFMDLLQRLVPGLADDIQNESIFTSSKSQYKYTGHYNYWKFVSDPHEFMDTGIKVKLYSVIQINASGANKSISQVFFKTTRNRKFSGYTAALDRLIPALFQSYYNYVSFANHIDANGFFDPVSYVPEMPDQYNLKFNNNAFEHHMSISEIYKELANKVF